MVPHLETAADDRFVGQNVAAGGLIGGVTAALACIPEALWLLLALTAARRFGDFDSRLVGLASLGEPKWF